MKKYDVLFVTSQLPYPANSGGTIKSWKLIEHLASKYRTAMVTILKGTDQSHEAEFLEKVDLVEYHSVALDISRSPLQLVKSYLRGRTLNNHRNYDEALAKMIKEMAEQAELVFVDHLEMYQYVFGLDTCKLVLHEHNAEYRTWEEFAGLTSNPLKSLLLQLEANRVKRTEIDYCNDADMVLAAPNDMKMLQKEGCMNPNIRSTYHLGDDTMLEKPDVRFNGSTKKVLYVGTLTWEPNVDGLIWFLENTWPLISGEDPDIEFDIVGGDPDPRLVRKVRGLKRVRLLGFVDDLEELYSSSKVFVAPLRFGSGMKVKVLNALYRGIPCVTSSIGVQGLKTRTGRHLLVANDHIQFASAVVHLCNEHELWGRLSENSRKLAREEYTWNSLLAQHVQQIDLMIRRTA